MKYDSLYERLLANSTIPEGQSETTGCWEWTGRTDGKRGGEYGRMNVWRDGKVKTVQPHREMEKIVAGKESLHPDEETIEHLCGNTRCINPDHWILLTRAKNTAEARAKQEGKRGTR